MKLLRMLCLCCAVAAAVPGMAAYGQEIKVQSTMGEQGFQVNAKGAIVVEAQTGRVLFAQSEHERLPIASTTKIMTALIALEQPDIDAVFPVNADAIKVEGSSMGLQAGDSASLRALATGMLLASGNDGANAAAVRIAGSVPAFAALMNRRAEAVGMENTCFETPSGLDGESHYSTAYDMALLAREALRNEAFAGICSQYKLRAVYGNPPYERWLTNHNKLLNYYDGAIGVKTGFTKKAGRCLVSAATRDGVTLICVTLGCPDDWNVHQSLLDRFFAETAVDDLAIGMPKVTVPVTGGTEAAVEAVRYEEALVPVPVGAPQVEYRVRVVPFLYAPVQSGQYIGEVEILLEGLEVATLTLVADRDVALLHPYEEKRSLKEWFLGLFEPDE